jgi:hypothetical protein
VLTAAEHGLPIQRKRLLDGRLRLPMQRDMLPLEVTGLSGAARHMRSLALVEFEDDISSNSVCSSRSGLRAGWPPFWRTSSRARPQPQRRRPQAAPRRELRRTPPERRRVLRRRGRRRRLRPGVDTRRRRRHVPLTNSDGPGTIRGEGHTKGSATASTACACTAGGQRHPTDGCRRAGRAPRAMRTMKRGAARDRRPGLR